VLLASPGAAAAEEPRGALPWDDPNQMTLTQDVQFELGAGPKRIAISKRLKP
jgi:hypothetical protein